jgi:hypothetical protein
VVQDGGHSCENLGDLPILPPRLFLPIVSLSKCCQKSALLSEITHILLTEGPLSINQDSPIKELDRREDNLEILQKIIYTLF